MTAGADPPACYCWRTAWQSGAARLASMAGDNRGSGRAGVPPM